MRKLFAAAVTVLLALVLAACTSTGPGPGTMFVTRSSAKSPAQLHQAMKDYAQQAKWLYIGENKLKGGEVTQVRLCIREAASDIWKAGMHLSAAMPCGHFGIYAEGGVTKVTMLHPRFLPLLDPNPIVEKLAQDVEGPFLAMLDAIAR